MRQVEARNRPLWRPIIACDSDIQDCGSIIESIDVVAQVLQHQLGLGRFVEIAQRRLGHRGADVEVPPRRCHLGAHVREVGDIGQPPRFGEAQHPRHVDQPLPAREVDRDHGCGPVTPFHQILVFGRDVFLAEQLDRGGRSDVAHDYRRVDRDGLTVPDHLYAGHRGAVGNYLDRIRGQPYLTTVGRYGVGDASPQPDRALWVETKPFERALAGEVGEEHPGRQILGTNSENRGTHVAEDAVHAFIFRVAGDPFGGGDLVFGQA